MYFRVWDLRVGGAKLSTSSASPRVFGVSPRLRRLSASSASLRFFGVSPRLRRLSASSASLRVFGVSGLPSFGVFGVSDQNSRAAAAITGNFCLMSSNDVDPRLTNPLPLIGIIVGILLFRPLKRKGFINHRSTLRYTLGRMALWYMHPGFLISTLKV